MSKITISGHSDDCIEIEGDLTTEFYNDDEKPSLLSFSDGTIVKIQYTDEGTWEVRVVSLGLRTKVVGTKYNDGPNGDSYTDAVTLEGEFTHVVCGTEITRWKKT